MSEPLTLGQQADLVDEIVLRCTMRGGDIAGETAVLLKREDVEHLMHLAGRLRRMAPYQSEISRVVTGK